MAGGQRRLHVTNRRPCTADCRHHDGASAPSQLPLPLPAPCYGAVRPKVNEYRPPVHGTSPRLLGQHHCAQVQLPRQIPQADTLQTVPRGGVRVGGHDVDPGANVPLVHESKPCRGAYAARYPPTRRLRWARPMPAARCRPHRREAALRPLRCGRATPGSRSMSILPRIRAPAGRNRLVGAESARMGRVT